MPFADLQLSNPVLLLAGLLGYLFGAALVWLGIRKLLPPQRERLASWALFEVLVVLFLVFLFWPSAAHFLVTETGLGELLYGAEVMEQVKAKIPPGDNLAARRIGLLITAMALPFQLLTIPLVLYALSETRPYQYGMTRHRLGSNVLLGVLGWLLLTPAVLAIYHGVSTLLERISPESVTRHAFEKLAESGQLTAIELGLIVFLAVAAAPILEELLFRGVVQGWLMRHDWGSHVLMATIPIMVLPWAPGPWRLLWERPSLETITQVLSPFFFVLLVLLFYVLLFFRTKSRILAAILASSLLFAMVHMSAWPSPVPLFLLALGLGWLAWRTQSLIGPIVLHSLFNGVACVQMFLL